jgi:membrane-bound ClpP family serine protease
MKPQTRISVLGWIAAVLLNVGTLLFIAGLVVPHGDGPGVVLIAGIALIAVGLASGAGWLFAARTGDHRS